MECSGSGEFSFTQGLLPSWQRLYRVAFVVAATVSALMIMSAVASAADPVLTFVEVHKDGVVAVDGLDGVWSVTVSPDGKHLYSAGESDNAVAVFSRDSTTGMVTFVEVQKDGVGSVDGISGARSVTVSPDGKHVYAAGRDDDAIAVFSRNSTTGSLTFVEVLKDGVGGVDGLNAAVWVTVGPDGRHLYGVGAFDQAVAVFGRNSTTGALTFVEIQKDGVAGVDGLSGASAVVVSSDGKHVYASGSDDRAVAVFSRHSGSGALTFIEVQKDPIGGVDGLDKISALTVSPDGNHVYTVSGLQSEPDQTLAVFSRNSTTGGLSFVELHRDGVGGVDGLKGAFSVVLSSDGEHVYAASRDDDAVAVFSRNATTGSLTFVEAQKDGVGGVDGLDAAISVTVSPDGDHVYVAGRDDDAVGAFSRSSTTGALTFVDDQKDSVGPTDGLDGATNVTVSPDGKHVYAAASTDGAVGVFSRKLATGALTFVEVQKDGVGGVDGLGSAFSAIVSPDGKHVYVAGSGDDAIAVFSRDSTTGGLSFVEMQQDGVGGVDGLDRVWPLTISPDGKHIYAASRNEHTIAVFSRNSTTGSITFVEVLTDDVGGVDGLRFVTSVSVSPDGKHVYAASRVDESVAVFSRNSVTGALTFVAIQKNGIGGVEGLSDAWWVTLSPDGKHLYATSNVSLTNVPGAVAVFARNSTTGALTFVEVHKDDIGGVEGLGDANSAVVSPDGQYVFVAGGKDEAIAVFSRNATTGALTFVEIQKDGVGGVEGLVFINSVTVSPDGGHVYSTAFFDDSLSVFSVASAPSADLSITKLATPTSVTAGSNLTYTVTVTNAGPDDASSVSVTDTLPGTATFVSASAGCAESGGTVTCTASNLANGANVQFTIIVTAPGTPGSISNTASVTSSTADPDSSDNSATLVTAVDPPPPVPGVTTLGLLALASILGAIGLAARRRHAMARYSQ